MKLPEALLFSTAHRWLTTAEAARYYGRTESMIRIWLKNGTCAEFGLLTYRDVTGHWWIGVPLVSENANTTTAALT